MSGFIEKLKGQPNFSRLGNVSKDKIVMAEQQLGLNFSQEFFDYIAECGIASITGHEFTGICTSERLNVVDVTRIEKHNNSQVPNDFYVVEQTNIDGIVIWQNDSGAVFQTKPGLLPIMICDSLEEYIRA